MAIMENARLVEIYIERARERGIAGSIYRGRVSRVLPGMQAAFVDVGLPKATHAAIRGGNAADNARIIRAVLAGERGPARDIVVLNAGAALFIAGRAGSVGEGMAQAAGAIDRGDAARALDRLAALSMAGESTAGAGA